MAALVLATEVVWGTRAAAPGGPPRHSRSLQPRSRAVTRQRRRVSAVTTGSGGGKSSYSDHEATIGRDEPPSPMRGSGQPPTPLR
jgi:hypothetical protein